MFALLKPYRPLIATLVVLTIAGNALNLVVPKLISHAIDAYTQRTFVLSTTVLQFFVVAFFVFALTYLQSVVQTYASERVAKDLRTRLAGKIALQSYSVGRKAHAGETSDQSHVRRGWRQAVRVPGHRLDHFVDFPDHRLEHPAALHQLASGAERPGRRPGHRRHVLFRAEKSARALQEGPGSHRLAEPRDQRKHSGSHVDPHAQLRRISSIRNSFPRTPRRRTLGSASCASCPA